MVMWRFLVASLVLACSIEACFGVVSFASLKNTISVVASVKDGQVLKAGEDNITITWSLDKASPAGTASTYKTVQVKLCYAPISQVDRAWRKTEDRLNKDKTCQFKVVKKPYTASNTTFTWTIEKDIPTATYFVRAYVFNSDNHEVAFGQTTNADKKTNLFKVEGITGRSVSVDVVSICFSVFSILALLGFFYVDKRNAKKK